MRQILARTSITSISIRSSMAWSSGWRIGRIRLFIGWSSRVFIRRIGPVVMKMRLDTRIDMRRYGVRVGGSADVPVRMRARRPRFIRRNALRLLTPYGGLELRWVGATGGWSYGGVGARAAPAPCGRAARGA